jgi:hypothetical protein
MINYDADNPFEGTPTRRKKGPKLRKCKECREPVVLDGYGEWVHSDTGLYFGRDAKGVLDHAATVV